VTARGASPARTWPTPRTTPTEKSSAATGAPKLGDREFDSVLYSELVEIAAIQGCKTKKTYNNCISPLRSAFDFGYKDLPGKTSPAAGLDCIWSRYPYTRRRGIFLSQVRVNTCSSPSKAVSSPHTRNSDFVVVILEDAVTRGFHLSRCHPMT
jgi:hypothetical protein